MQKKHQCSKIMQLATKSDNKANMMLFLQQNSKLKDCYICKFLVALALKNVDLEAMSTCQYYICQCTSKRGLNILVLIVVSSQMLEMMRKASELSERTLRFESSNTSVLNESVDY